MNRYQTLDVTLQTDNRNLSRLSQTLDVDQSREQETERPGQSDQRVKKFRELYYRNEKLRKQLKLLNMRLNQKLEKIKLPNVKKRAASVDLNHQPPKALQRELENAYKQIKMYKSQVQILKIKQQSAENYAKLRDMENMISYKDKQIYNVQQQIISAKNIKKMQQKKIASQLENQQIKDRLDNYKLQHKSLKDKLKLIARKSRKREQQYKKQQAYLVSLQKKVRDVIELEKKQVEIQNNPVEKFQKPNREINQKQFKEVKQEIANQKHINDQILKKIQISKKAIKQQKMQKNQKQIKLKDKEALVKALQTKIMALHRLIREQQRKQRQQPPPPNKVIENIQEQNIQFNDMGDDDSDSQQHEQSGTLNGILHQLDNVSGGQGYSKNSNNRSWKGKYRKVQHGFGAPSDKKYQHQGQLIGFNVSLDQNQSICGISFILNINGNQKTTQFLGNHSNVQLKWVCDKNDKICKISGSFTEQSYLNELIVTSQKGKTGVFGASSTDPFMFILNSDQIFSGCFGSVRQLGNDMRLTQFGFWVSGQ